MKEFHLQIVTPDGLVFDGQAGQLSVRSIDGDIAILAGHIPYVTALKEGECRVYTGDTVKRASCSGGLLTVTKEDVRLVSSDFDWKE
ncbi:MAG: F0F1 ATP synthase subunit epsilon [Clostridia bacterium]|nr:F0F1 ATP synthase subunit epsilon [Clostridia bacterium]